MIISAMGSGLRPSQISKIHHDGVGVMLHLHIWEKRDYSYY